MIEQNKVWGKVSSYHKVRSYQSRNLHTLLNKKVCTDIVTVGVL